MKTFQIITDSTSDMELEFRNGYDVDYAPMTFLIDSTEYLADLDWTKLSYKDYYDTMRAGKQIKTSMIDNKIFIDKVTSYLKQGLDVLYVACSSKLSGSVNRSKQLIDEIAPSFPDRKVIAVDSIRSLYAEGSVAMFASKLQNEGKTIDEVAKIIENEKHNFQTFATVESLEWLKKAGRVSAGSAFFGSILQIKPLIVSASNGCNYAFEKVSGRKKSMHRLVQILNERATEKTTTVFVEHADCVEDAELLASMIEKETGITDIHVSVIGPIVGATVGPGTLTISFYGKKMDIDSKEE